jgi:prepilin-type processing-associated H-X9-DG protein
VGTFARLREWLYRPVKGATPPGPDDLVEVCRFSGFDGRQRADLAVFELGANGIKAMAQHNDAHGNAPHYAFVDGHRVLVFGRDLEVAAAVLRED